MKRTIFAIATALSVYAGNAHAHLGWTLHECQQRWGAYHVVPSDGDGYRYFFHYAGFTIRIALLNDQVNSITYYSFDIAKLRDLAEGLLHKNADANWQSVDSIDKNDIKYWEATDSNGNCIYYAVLRPSATTPDYFLQISTERWDQHIKSLNKQSLQNL
jgi:hypothetical protein